jgi:hypothetical protein
VLFNLPPLGECSVEFRPISKLLRAEILANLPNPVMDELSPESDGLSRAIHSAQRDMDMRMLSIEVANRDPF